jgi:hypothetical protein
MPWSREFDDPVPGMKTLRDAATYIMNLPVSEKKKPHWQAAAEALLMAAEDRSPLMHARIGMLRALSHGKPTPVRPLRRKGGEEISDRKMRNPPA